MRYYEVQPTRNDKAHVSLYDQLNPTTDRREVRRVTRIPLPLLDAHVLAERLNTWREEQGHVV